MTEIQVLEKIERHLQELSWLIPAIAGMLWIIMVTLWFKRDQP